MNPTDPQNTAPTPVLDIRVVVNDLTLASNLISALGDFAGQLKREAIARDIEGSPATTANDLCPDTGHYPKIKLGVLARYKGEDWWVDRCKKVDGEWTYRLEQRHLLDQEVLAAVEWVTAAEIEEIPEIPF